MKISIITFHFAYNIGAVLQSWALQTALERCGHEANIIDYRPRYHTRKYAICRNPIYLYKDFYEKSEDTSWMRRVYKSIRKALGNTKYDFMHRYSRIEKKRKFENFMQNNLRLTERYTSFKQLKKYSPIADIYVAGSDQIWNKRLTNNCFDNAYFLDFGDENTKRFVYAASCGETKSQEICLNIRSLSHKIDFISSRENTTAEELKEELKKECYTVVDPTLLLDSKEYQAVESLLEIEEPYVVVYMLQNNKILEEGISRYMARNKRKVINISPFSIPCEGVIHKNEVAPGEFLTYIKNAEFVITNSFHGTVFSIIYNKNFVSAIYENRGLRIISLLEEFELSHRLVTDVDEFEEVINCPIDYTNIEEKKKLMREECLEHFRGFLGEDDY